MNISKSRQKKQRMFFMRCDKGGNDSSYATGCVDEGAGAWRASQPRALAPRTAASLSLSSESKILTFPL